MRNVEKSNKAGLDTTEFVESLNAQFDQASAYLYRFITRLQEYVLGLARTRDDVPLENLLNFEQRLSDHNGDIEHYFQVLLDHADRLDSLTLDSSGPREFAREKLPVRAERILGRAELAAEQVRELTRRIRDGSADARSQTELEVAETRFNWTTRSLSNIVRMLNRVDVPTAEYRQFLISATGTLTEDIFDIEVLGGLLDNFLANAARWLQESGPTAMFRVALFILIVVVFSWLGKLCGRLVSRGLRASRLHLSTALESMVASIVARIALAIGIVFGLSQLGVEIGPLLAGIGIIGFAVGFALQETLSNFASGTMLLAYRPFDAGDVIEAGGITATVERLSLVNTTLLTFDNRRVTVPNNKIWGDVIVNITAMETRRVDITIGVAHHERLERVEAILHEIVNSHPDTLDNPEPMIKVHSIDESAVRMVVRPWVRVENYWPTYWDLNRQIKLRFEQESVQFGAQRISVASQGSDAGFESNP